MIITANMATIPERISIAESAVDSILPQVDLVRVYLNRFDKAPAFIRDNPKIVFFMGEDLGPAGKYYWGSNKNEYYFSIDDDFIYPPTYVQDHMNFLQAYNDEVVVTLHGSIMNSPRITKYHSERKVFRCLKPVTQDVVVHIGGTGVMALNTNRLSIDINAFNINFGMDIEVAIQAQDHNVPIIVRKHTDNYLMYMKPSVPTVWERMIDDDSSLVKLFNSRQWVLPDIMTCQCRSYRGCSPYVRSHINGDEDGVFNNTSCSNA